VDTVRGEVLSAQNHNAARAPARKRRRSSAPEVCRCSSAGGAATPEKREKCTCATAGWGNAYAMGEAAGSGMRARRTKRRAGAQPNVYAREGACAMREKGGREMARARRRRTAARKERTSRRVSGTARSSAGGERQRRTGGAARTGITARQRKRAAQQ